MECLCELIVIRQDLMYHHIGVKLFLKENSHLLDSLHDFFYKKICAFKKQIILSKPRPTNNPVHLVNIIYCSKQILLTGKVATQNNLALARKLNI